MPVRQRKKIQEVLRCVTPNRARRRSRDSCSSMSLSRRAVFPSILLRRGALVHESVGGAHGTFWRPKLLPDRLGFRLAQLNHPVQYMAPEHPFPLLRFVAARARTVSERPLVPEEKILDGALSSIP